MPGNTPASTPEFESYAREQAASYLRGIRDRKRHIAALNAEVDELRSLASGLRGIDYARDAPSAPATGDAMPLAVARLLDVVDERVQLLREYAGMLEECGAAISALGGTQADILRYRYLCDWQWERIAAETHYSEQWLYELHNQALAAFYRHMPARYRDPIAQAL